MTSCKKITKGYGRHGTEKKYETLKVKVYLFLLAYSNQRAMQESSLIFIMTFQKKEKNSEFHYPKMLA